MKEQKKTKINPIQDGPLEVENLSRLTNSRGEPVDSSRSIELCRCGKSHTKPFCDKSHEMSGFTSEKCDDRVPDKKEHYKGKYITIHDNRGICSHAGFCTSLLSQVFHGGEPWIDPDAVDIEKIKEVIEMCPSGALSYSINGRETKDLPHEEEIIVSKNGPYYVRGGIELVDVDLGDDAFQEHYTLCRCGDSCNKPRCDGSHWYSDFKDDEALTISGVNRRREVLEAGWVFAARVEDFQKTMKLVLNIKGRTIILTKVGDDFGAI